MRSGWINIGNGVFAFGGDWILGQSSSEESKHVSGFMTGGVRHLHINGDTVMTSAGPSHRWLGFSLRCLEWFN